MALYTASALESSSVEGTLMPNLVSLAGTGGDSDVLSRGSCGRLTHAGHSDGAPGKKVRQPCPLFTSFLKDTAHWPVYVYVCVSCANMCVYVQALVETRGEYLVSSIILYFPETGPLTETEAMLVASKSQGSS